MTDPVSDPPPDAPAREAVARLFEQYGPRVYALGLRMCDSPQAAEDLVQETFLRALSSWEAFEGRAKPSTWLYTIASRACQRMRRRRAGEPRHLDPIERLLPSGEEDVVQIPSGADPSEEAALAEAVDAVRAAVSDLPLDFRMAFVLKEVLEFRVSEIADILGVSENTVKTRLHRARLKVRSGIAGALPRSPGEPPDHSREECLVLLTAKQEALDHDAPFPVPDSELCGRCRSVFATLDLGRDICRSLGSGEELPGAVRARVRRALEG